MLLVTCMQSLEEGRKNAGGGPSVGLAEAEAELEVDDEDDVEPKADAGTDMKVGRVGSRFDVVYAVDCTAILESDVLPSPRPRSRGVVSYSEDADQP